MRFEGQKMIFICFLCVLDINRWIFTSRFSRVLKTILRATLPPAKTKMVSIVVFVSLYFKINDFYWRKSMTINDKKSWKVGKLFYWIFSIWNMSGSWHHSKVSNLELCLYFFMLLCILRIYWPAYWIWRSETLFLNFL